MSEDEGGEAWAPSVRTLPTADRPMRVAEFHRLFAEALRDLDRPEPSRLLLSLEQAPGRADTVRELTRRESACCSFFVFILREQDGLLLEVAVPPAHVAVLDGVAELATRASGLMDAGTLRTGQVAEAAGLNPQTLRY